VIAVVLAVGLLASALGSIGGIGGARSLAVDLDGRYRFLRETPDGGPFRWDPCQPIHYEVNVADAPAAALGDVRQAIARVSGVSGFRFVFDGTTTRTADEQIGRAFQTGGTETRWLPVLIVWTPHEHFDYLSDTKRAAAFAMPRAGDGFEHETYRSGLVVIDAGQSLPPGFDVRYSEGVVLMHELGHVMGLAHVADGGEVMWSPSVWGADRFPDPGLTDWGPGDRRGLEILGEHEACPAA
jgi:hypothetical protein